MTTYVFKSYSAVLIKANCPGAGGRAPGSRSWLGHCNHTTNQTLTQPSPNEFDSIFRYSSFIDMAFHLQYTTINITHLHINHFFNSDARNYFIIYIPKNIITAQVSLRLNN